MAYTHPMDWKEIKEGHPDKRQPVLLCDATVQEAQVAWWDGVQFCRWAGGGVEGTMHMPTHWCAIDWPETGLGTDYERITTWEEGFATWERLGRMAPPLRLFDTDAAEMSERIAAAEHALETVKDGLRDKNMDAWWAVTNALEKLPWVRTMLKKSGL